VDRDRARLDPDDLGAAPRGDVRVPPPPRAELERRPEREGVRVEARVPVEARGGATVAREDVEVAADERARRGLRVGERARAGEARDVAEDGVARRAARASQHARLDLLVALDRALEPQLGPARGPAEDVQQGPLHAAALRWRVGS